ncbi:MAG: acyl-CoA dehydrogenase [Deltaproteobacteria bacterium]|nr:MAG: acyl-CoA dehydrogenase [Deltaproteobacteria bacterium]
MCRGLAGRCAEDGRLSRALLDEVQPEAFTLARLLAERSAAASLVPWAQAQGELERGLAALYVASFVRNVGQVIAWEGSAFGVDPERASALAGLRGWVEEATSTAVRVGLGRRLLERSHEPSGALGIGDDHREMQRLFARFADERIAPVAEEIHRHDRLIPEPLLQELAELGVFGISIPEEYGGSFIDHLTMCLATEELSRGSLGAGGSVITRPEICAKAILKGGTDDQKRKWLPRIASAETLVSVAVTEPNAGSDVAAVRVTAERIEGGWLIDGEKTWCTFAGRADAFILLARTGTPDSGHRGLTLFLAEKPAFGAGEDEHSFVHRQEGGGSIEGHAIPTIGYRGMHSYTVTFDRYFVPEENRIGEEGKGFILQMQGFAGGRIQTAARAVGVMEAAFRKALSYAGERQVFGRSLADFSMTSAKLADMAATLQASRQLGYHVARQMDEGEGDMEASLVKLLSCKDAEWLTREAMQLHGGMGYSEEYAVSRYWQDARVLSIFEGAEEVLALYVVARQVLAGALSS